VPVPRIEKARSHRDELRQILIHGPQSIGHPRADGRETPVQHVATGMKLNLRAMIVIRGPHGTQHRDVIRTAPHMRKPMTEFKARLTIGFEPGLKRVKFVALLSVGIVDDHHANPFEQFRILHPFEGRFSDGFTGVSVELRFGVEAFHVTHPATHKQPDHVLGFGRQVWRSETRPRYGLGITAQQGLESNASESESGTGQKMPTIQP